MGIFGKNADDGVSEEIRRELEAERELAKDVAESRSRMAPQCPECGAFGTLEEIDGVLRCIDCDEVVAATTKLAGFGRR
jgi:ribosomal protein L37AE/L43A